MSSVYVYAFIDRPDEDGEELRITGLDGGPVAIVAHGRVGCVVGGQPVEDLRTASREKLLRCLLCHQQVVEGAMRGHTVLPIKFGTTLNALEAVTALLRQTEHKLVEALESMRGKVEVEVAATWDIDRALEAVKNEAAVARAREALTVSGDPTLEKKVRLGQVVKVCLDRRRDEYRERMLTLLEPVSCGVAPNALVSDEMVMNVAFLLDQAQQCEFDSRVQRLDELFERQISFRVIGPLAPYSFTTAEVVCLTPTEVEEAQKMLDLVGVLTEPEIRKAYRRMAAKGHQNMVLSTKASSDNLTKLAHAAEVLLSSLSAGYAGEGSSAFAVTIRGIAHREVAAGRFGAGV